ncbi:triose-phosphate isomerase [Bacteroides sp. OttesenSCG-928-J23]|nr:triose-phosphate isomerase [Bacteroides sp. OttesenSCG-928-J23]MDL2291890.1 triose-phosphate isomerase [Bacteroides sp. OttesenSCG-928-F21]
MSVVFIISGFVKAVDPLGSLYKIQDYVEAFGLSSWIPVYFIFIGAFVLFTLEFVLGVLLLFGIKKDFSTLLILLFMLFMTPLTLYLAITNPVSDCGCFGDAWVLTNWQTFWKNIFLLVAAVSVFVWRERIVRFISEKSEWLISLYSILFILGLSLYCLNRLPILDFRAYKIGTNIPEGMQMPPDAEATVIETVFILEKEGKKQTFTIDNYPDSTWTFVDTRTIVKQQGYEPAITDFSMIEQETGEDVTERILSDDNYTFLLVSHRIENANDSNIDLINEIYDYSVEYGYSFYGLTASLDYQIEQWRGRTGAEYPFCLMDDITLKTIVRSNPGLLLIKNGVILNKWSHNALPDEYELHAALDQLPLGKQKSVNDFYTILQVLLWFFIPLLLVNGIDAWVFGRKERYKSTIINPLTKKEMRKNIVAGNWKMNKTLQEGIELVKELKEVLENDKPNCEVVVCTPFIHLASVATILEVSSIGVGAENCADKVSGAYTGEVSASMVASTGAKYVILGHSERRAYYGETAEILKEKTKLALANDLTPIFCIGEVLEEREANKQNEVVYAQLAGSLFDLSAEEFSKIVLAYEPVWAIGTGKTATSEQAQEIHAYIRSLIVEKYGEEVAANTSILYGGSCNPSNAKELFSNPDVDGGLIGGAALKVADFKGVIDGFKA